MSGPVLAIVPARGGSVGVPGKNLRVLAGRTLVGWALQAAREARLVDDVVVTTDDQAIADEAKRYGALAVRRPGELATSGSALDDALRHCLDELRFEGTVVVLQPTAPARRAGLVDDCVRRLTDSGADSLLTGTRLHFVWTARGEPLVRNRRNRQELREGELLYHEDGAVFVFKAEVLRRTGSRVGGYVVVLENEPTVDIDTEDDLVAAEVQLLSRHP